MTAGGRREREDAMEERAERDELWEKASPRLTNPSYFY